MYPVEFVDVKIEDTTDSNTSAFYVDLLLSTGRERVNVTFSVRQT